MAPVARPLASSSMRCTYELGRISQRPVFSAMRMAVASELDFAPTSQANARQKPQLMQALRPGRGCERIAMGAGKGCQPSLRAARSKSTPLDFTGSGGMGYGLERGESNGLAPAWPETPISHSTLV